MLSIHEDAAAPTFPSRFSITTNVSNLQDTNLSLPLITTIVTGIARIPDPVLAQDRIQDLLAPLQIVTTVITTTINPLQLRNLQGLTAKAAMFLTRMPLPAHPNNNLLTIPPTRLRIKVKAKKLHIKPLLLR